MNISAPKTFQPINFGCRANAAETNQLSQILVELNLTPVVKNADVYLINTCAITKKGEYESLSKIRKLSTDNPNSLIIATGCANLNKLPLLPNLYILSNHLKDALKNPYTPAIADKFSHTFRYLLKVQSGCSVKCTFCTVPLRRSDLNSLSINMAVDTVKKAVRNGYKEVIITGVNLAQYLPGLSNLVESILLKTNIKFISFGSVPLLCIDDKFLKLLTDYPTRISRFIHIPLQSGSSRILKLMHRPYSQFMINQTFSNLKKISALSFGTDIIVGFPGETNKDFLETYNLCKSIGFAKIHCFPYSPRPGTSGRELYLKFPKLSKTEISARSRQIRSLVN